VVLVWVAIPIIIIGIMIRMIVPMVVWQKLVAEYAGTMMLTITYLTVDAFLENMYLAEMEQYLYD
jgi:hypothetical protein